MRFVGCAAMEEWGAFDGEIDKVIVLCHNVVFVVGWSERIFGFFVKRNHTA